MTPFSPKATPAQRHKAIGQLVQELSADTRPIILGPFRSELGFEVSYWIPMLRWLATKVPKFDQRACVVTRGGLAPLYQHVAARGYDLYALRSVTEVRRENLFDQQQTGLLKQMRPTAWDEQVIADTAQALGLGALYHTVHPAWMYWGLEPYWADDAGMKYLAAVTDYALLPKPALPEGCPPLPKQFVAVKFYSRATFQYPHPEIADFVTRTVGVLATQTPVVVLASSGEHDDHSDIACSGPNIISLPADLPAETNLLWQAAVMSRATAFVGTYGGVAQLALRLGVPSVSFWKEWGGTAFGHLALSQWLSKVTKVPFVASSMDDAWLMSQVLTVPKVAA